MPAAVTNSSMKHQPGLTYVEMMITVMITAIIMVALMGVVNTATETGKEVLERNALARQARFAMARMVTAVGGSHQLLLPLVDNPNTDWPENLREQTVPPTPPLGSSALATAVLAVTLSRSIDLDGDGVADADNDGDGLIDEDLPNDSNNDGAAGIGSIDDDGDGLVDESTVDPPKRDDDEDNSAGEDWLNGVDDDGDANVDEDAAADVNGDSEAGIVAVDDDGDGAIDEGSASDDDEDGSINEDWYDAVVFYLQPSFLGRRTLIERTPVPWDNNGDNIVDGADYNETIIASNVSRFRVERIGGDGLIELVDITLELTDPGSGESINLQTRVRLGGAL